MKKIDKALILSSLAFLLAALGCGDSDGNATGIYALADGEELPTCNADHSGELYMAHSGESFYCNGKGSWQKLESSKGGTADSVRSDTLISRDTVVLSQMDTLVIHEKDTLVLRDTVFGANGESCTVKALANESGYKILCGNDSVGVILHGTKGDSGVPGANAENCTLSDDGNGSVKVICATDTATLYKAVCGTEPYDPAKNFCASTGTKDSVVAFCDGATYNLSTQFCASTGTKDTVVALCGGDSYNLSTHFCANGNTYKTSEYSFVTTEYLNQTMLKNGNYGYLVDSRDKRVYRTIQIGTQTWMAQNLNYATADSYCYEVYDVFCAIYGRLYTWDASRTACPAGWHLPDTTEFRTLSDAAGGEAIAGLKLKSTSGWMGNGNGTDDFGFSALPAGFRTGTGFFTNAGWEVRFWTATERDGVDSYFSYDALFLYSGNKNWLHSVRCLKDSDL